MLGSGYLRGERRRAVSDEECREGYYKDKYGRWQKDRRQGGDRRANEIKDSYPLEHERRKVFRRKADREQLEQDHRVMIEDALDDFAAEHHGRL